MVVLVWAFDFLDDSVLGVPAVQGRLEEVIGWVKGTNGRRFVAGKVGVHLAGLGLKLLTSCHGPVFFLGLASSDLIFPKVIDGCPPMLSMPQDTSITATNPFRSPGKPEGGSLFKRNDSQSAYLLRPFLRASPSLVISPRPLRRAILMMASTVVPQIAAALEAALPMSVCSRNRVIRSSLPSDPYR